MLIWYQATYQRSLLSQHPGGSNRAPVTGQCGWMVLTGNLCIMIRPLLVKDALESRTSRLESPLEAGNSSRKAQPAIVPYVTLCQQDGNLRVPWVAIYPHIYIYNIHTISKLDPVRWSVEYRRSSSPIDSPQVSGNLYFATSSMAHWHIFRSLMGWHSLLVDGPMARLVMLAAWCAGRTACQTKNLRSSKQKHIFRGVCSIRQSQVLW